MISKKRKKALVGLTTYSLILILMIVLLISSISFYDTSKEDILLKNKKQEILNSILTFRSDLINIISTNNSNLTYINSYDVESIIIYLENTSIIGEDLSLNEKVKINITSLGIGFCSSYNFSSNINVTFTYNGTCIFM